MKKAKRIELIAFLFLAAACVSAQSPSPNPPSAATAPRRVQVDADSASALVLQKAPIKYPDAAHNTGIQGLVVLRVVTGESGDVKEVTIVSGDPALAQAAADSVKLWKYKPYMSEGSPAEMETQLTINFR
jgi:TonB family protein